MFIDASALDEVQKVLGTHVPEYEVWAFGSRVHGRNLKPFSDLDLVVITQKPLDMLRLLDLKEAFIESDIPFKVDVLDWATLNDRFRLIVEQEHVVVKQGLQGN